MERCELIVRQGERNVRLEDFLFDRFPNLSRMYLREVVRDARCEVNGRVENVGHRLRVDDFIEIEIDPKRETAMLPENIELDIIFEDAHLMVVNKPAGMLVHPTHRDKRGTLLNAVAYHLNAKLNLKGDSVARSSILGNWPSEQTKLPDLSASAFRVPPSAFIRPGLVHRLDKQTSGLMVIAKSVAIHRQLAKQFQKKHVEKKYLALVEGVVTQDEGQIEGTIGRYAEEKRWDLKHDGKHSTSRFRVLERNSDTTLVDLEPVTGRTNQLRIHCASIGHPIVGDVGRGGREHARLCLHAFKLSFDHPVNRTRLSFEAHAAESFLIGPSS